MTNPYRIRQHPETGRWELHHGDRRVAGAMDRDGLMAQIRNRAQDWDRTVDRLMEELATARFRVDALTELLDDEDDS